ncbi:transmembrane channel-like protein 6b [Oncorhynchus tshawytscha]|uniref:transmembrane channel-like protein 6b n=1 Tax=Oncorhynchus tshawytscha TaxID=74940 RepID=UPI001C3CD7D8|nr:transmembrane channel-like protein 6b [Oncorhynchus tshawytscha]
MAFVYNIKAGLESPADEEGVHDSFNQLIEDQRQEALELQELQRDLDEEERDSVAYLSSPGQEIWRGSPWRGEEEGGRQLDPLLEERWSSATLKVLSSMPSRTIGRSRGAIISQYYNRTMKLRRRRQSRPSIKDFSRSARPSIRGHGMETDCMETEGVDEEGRKRDQLVNNLQNLSLSDRVRMLRAMPLSVAEKSELRRLADRKGQRSNHSQISCCSQLKYHIIIALRHSWYSCLSFLHSLQLWQVALKRVSGRFGTGVLSYFLFVKTLLFFNIFLFLVTGLLLAVPQAVHPPTLTQGHEAFSGLELLTGGGYFSDSVMYYGYYSNSTLSKDCRVTSSSMEQQPSPSVSRRTMETDCGGKPSYNMPLAYFFTIGLAFFITCIILVYSMSKSFGQSFRIDKSHGILAMKVFCSWDFKVIKKTSVKLRSENICIQLRELLEETSRKHVQKTACQRIGRVLVHVLAWFICIGSTVACVLALYYFSEYMHKDLQYRSRIPTKDPLLKEASLLALPVVVSLINLLLPGIFNATAWMEEYDSPSVNTYIAISRNLMLKVSVLVVLCFHWLGRIASDPNSIGLQCWESFVGQELYRFLLMDFIFTILDTFFGEFLWRLFSQRVLKRKRKPVFDISRNVLELIYGQTLAWLGVLFTPLLPAVQIIKLLLLFYMKQTSVMMNCQSPRKPYRASQMSTIFITLLCCPSFLGAAVCVSYTMWSIRPSESCGPFRSLSTMFQSGKLWVKELETHNPNLAWLAWAHSYIVENPLFLFLAAGIFLIVIYFNTQVVDGQRKIISLLQEQIENEGEDKKFLITRLQAIHQQKRPLAPRRLTSQASQDSNC